jgi:hypothetical protein
MKNQKLEEKAQKNNKATLHVLFLECIASKGKENKKSNMDVSIKLIQSHKEVAE